MNKQDIEKIQDEKPCFGTSYRGSVPSTCAKCEYNKECLKAQNNEKEK